MSSTHVGAALHAPADISPTERLLLALLASYADPDGVAYPGVDRLAADANVSPSTVVHALRRLTAQGLIECIARQAETGTGSAWHLLPGAQAGDGAEEGSA